MQAAALPAAGKMHSVWAESSRPRDTKDTQRGDDKGSDKYLQAVVITNAQSILKSHPGGKADTCAVIIVQDPQPPHDAAGRGCWEQLP